MTASVSIEAIGIGLYNARLRGWSDVTDPDTEFEYEINLRTLLGLRTHINNAIDQLKERQVKDAICGDCKVCGNVRLVVVQQHGHGVHEYCPKCKPKLDRAEQKGLLL